MLNTLHPSTHTLYFISCSTKKLLSFIQAKSLYNYRHDIELYSFLKTVMQILVGSWGDLAVQQM